MDVNPHKWSQVERRTGKVRRPKTDVLPLCHATIIQLLLYDHDVSYADRNGWAVAHGKRPVPSLLAIGLPNVTDVQITSYCWT